ncbi:MAG: hypothetical protein QG594_2477, partial [Bacteroidota bacterium]|nr:hypothetical protein [Bacteroidota bacterium]
MFILTKNIFKDKMRNIYFIFLLLI